MDLGDEKSEDNAKYSFLLGAALRNDDPDQFMNIYDDILPKDIRPDEVTWGVILSKHDGDGSDFHVFWIQEFWHVMISDDVWSITVTLSLMSQSVSEMMCQIIHSKFCQSLNSEIYVISYSLAGFPECSIPAVRLTCIACF